MKERHLLFAIVGDIHGATSRLTDLVEVVRKRENVSAVLATGDFSRFTFRDDNARAYRVDVDTVFSILRTLQKPIMWVRGNHDDPNLGGAGCIDRQQVSWGGIRIGGFGGAPMGHGFPYEWYDVPELSESLVDCHIALCHSPPAGCDLDVLHGTSKHVGSTAVRSLAEKMNGLLVCGHIHEGVGVARIGQAFCYNAGSLGKPFGAQQIGFVEVRPDGSLVSVTHVDVDLGVERVWTVS